MQATRYNAKQIIIITEAEAAGFFITKPKPDWGYLKLIINLMCLFYL